MGCSSIGSIANAVGTTMLSSFFEPESPATSHYPCCTSDATGGLDHQARPPVLRPKSRAPEGGQQLAFDATSPPNHPGSALFAFHGAWVRVDAVSFWHRPKLSVLICISPCYIHYITVYSILH